MVNLAKSPQSRGQVVDGVLCSQRVSMKMSMNHLQRHIMSIIGMCSMAECSLASIYAKTSGYYLNLQRHNVNPLSYMYLLFLDVAIVLCASYPQRGRRVVSKWSINIGAFASTMLSFFSY